MLSRGLTIFALVCASSAGCETTLAPLADGGVARQLVILDPPGQQLGLRYGESLTIGVKYEIDDAMAQPLRSQPVRFAIFDDPGGSTLSADTVTTDGSGTALVTLTAGSQELSFQVHASAANATDVVFDVSVSQQSFVTIDAVLTDPVADPGIFTAALFIGTPCAQLPPTSQLSGEDRSLSSASPTVSATLTFRNLLPRAYALVGRLDDENGTLVAYGCLDLDATLSQPGAHLTAPVALVSVTPSVVGEFALTTSLASPRSSRTDTRFASVDIVDRCPGHAGQLLVDALVPLVSSARATLIAAQRGTTAPSTDGSSTVSCRAAQVGTASSLDAQVGALLEATTDGAQRTNLLADLDTILQSGSLGSDLTLSATLAHADDRPGSQRLVAVHAARQLSFSLGTSIDLTKLDLPVRIASGFGALAADDTLTLDAHTLTVDLPTLWGQTFSTASIATRLPALTDATFSGWLTATVAATQHGGKTGCAAIEDLVCSVTGTTGCAGTIAGPCATAVTNVGDALETSFAGGGTLELSGMCVPVDSTSDLVADSLVSGIFDGSGPLTGTLDFTGAREM